MVILTATKIGSHGNGHMIPTEGALAINFIVGRRSLHNTETG